MRGDAVDSGTVIGAPGVEKEAPVVCFSHRVERQEAIRETKEKWKTRERRV